MRGRATLAMVGSSAALVIELVGMLSIQVRNAR
jgi:hypothetical protein